MKWDPTKALAIASLGMSAGTTGCAGPTTPLGAVWNLRLPDLRQGILMRNLASENVGDVRIRILPVHQILHDVHTLRIAIESVGSAGQAIAAEPRISVLHNHRDVSGAFLIQASRAYSPDSRRLEVDYPGLRLSPSEDHQIEFRYEDDLGRKAFAVYEPPSCEPRESGEWQASGHFSPNEQIRSAIERASTETGFNPAFTAALVAQESGFNPMAISWARAVGLTQITPVAESELQDLDAQSDRWPRYEGLEKLPVPVIRALVLSGEINDSNEWRLDPEKSVRGGLSFVRFLDRLWATPENLERVSRVIDARLVEAERTRLILASYHSGYTRVQQALERAGANWIKVDELKGARVYVNRIFSYCDHFARAPESSSKEQEEAP